MADLVSYVTDLIIFLLINFSEYLDFGTHDDQFI